jgi:Sec-independent protein translocase protein TatA
MPSVGPQELADLGVLLLSLVAFGSAKFSSTARNLGKLLGGRKCTVEEAKSDLIPEEVKEAQDTRKDLKSESLCGTQHDKTAPQTLAPLEEVWLFGPQEQNIV